MSLAATVLGNVKYPPERIIEARPVTTGANVPLTYVDLPRGGQERNYLLTVKEVGNARNANISFMRVEGTLFGRRYQRDLAPGTVAHLVDTYIPWEVPLFETMFVTEQASAVIANYQSRVIYEARDFSVAEKVALGATDENLTSEENALRDAYNIPNKISRGELPMSRPLGTLIKRELYSYNQILAANLPQNVAEVTVVAGEKVILRRIWTFRPAANVTALTVTVEREKQPLMNLWPHVLPDYNTSMNATDLFVPALEQMRIYLTSTTGHIATDSGIVVELETRKLTLWDKVAWGLINNKRYTSNEDRAAIKELDLENLVKAGIYSVDLAWLHTHPEYRGVV